jgi:hypothetical protein
VRTDCWECLKRVFYGFFTVDFVAHHDTGRDFLDRPCALFCSWPWKNVLPEDGMQLLPR